MGKLAYGYNRKIQENVNHYIINNKNGILEKLHNLKIYKYVNYQVSIYFII